MAKNSLSSPRVGAVIAGVVTVVIVGSTSPATATVAPPASGVVIATALSVSAPRSTPVGAPFTVTVRATGAHDKVDKGYRGTVRLTAAHARLPKAYTFKASDHGVHRFSVTLEKLGRVTVTASGGHKLTGKVPVRGITRATRTTVSCGSKTLAFGDTRSCAVTVTDHSPGKTSRPAGTVTLTAKYGHFGPPASCTLPARGTDRCTATYTTQYDGRIPVTATFVPARSDRFHAKSVGSSALTVCPYEWTVDAASGSDSNPGTCDKPFETLAKALSVATSGDAIKLTPGSDYPTGSTPLVVPAGVTITGQHSHSEPGLAGLIVGDLVLSHPSSSLVELGVEGTVTASGADETLSDDSVFDPGPIDTCVQVTAGSLTATSSSIHGCSVGIEVTGTGAITVTDTTLNNAEVNVAVDTDATADLNGGNTLSCAATADLDTQATASIDASNDIWDHATPTTATTTPPAGVDIYNTGTGEVTTTGATVAAHPCA